MPPDMCGAEHPEGQSGRATAEPETTRTELETEGAEPDTARTEPETAGAEPESERTAPRTPAEIAVFAYGSLMFEPELPHALQARQPARLRGYRRSFNKLSLRRATPRAESFDAFSNVPPAFREADRNLSLALGTEAGGAADAICGELQIYPREVADELLALLDRREGYDARRSPEQNGYLRERVPLEVEVPPAEVQGLRRHIAAITPRTPQSRHTAAHGRRSRMAAPTPGTHQSGYSEAHGGPPHMEAIAYLSNTAPNCRFTIGREVDLATRARVLINATPHTPGPPGTDIARGLHYLEGCRRSLAAAGIVDPALEELAAALRALPGPWVSLVNDPAARGTATPPEEPGDAHAR